MSRIYGPENELFCIPKYGSGKWYAQTILEYNQTNSSQTEVTYLVKFGVLFNPIASSYSDHREGNITIYKDGSVDGFEHESYIDDSESTYWFASNRYTFSRSTADKTVRIGFKASSLKLAVNELVSPLTDVTHTVYYTYKTASGSSNAALLEATLSIPALNQYTVTFYANSHGTAPSPQTIYYGYRASEPTPPTAVGYDFLGWYTDTNYTTKWDFNTAITGTTNLYARWQERSYKIIYDPNGGTGNVLIQNKLYTASVNLYNQSSANYNKITQAEDAPTIRHTLANWNTSSAGSGTTYTLNQQLISGSLTNNLYLYAIWQPQFIYPTISNLKVIRTEGSSEQDTTEYDDGEYLYITFNWTGYSTNGQASSPTYAKPTCIITVDETYTYNPTLSGTASANNVSFSYKITNRSFSRDLSHSISIELFNPNDTTQRADASTTIATAILPIDLYGSGSDVYMGIMHPYVSGQVITIPNLFIDTTGTTTIDTAIQTALTNLGWTDVLN